MQSEPKSDAEQIFPQPDVREDDESYLDRFPDLKVGTEKPMGYIHLDSEEVFTRANSIINALLGRGQHAAIISPEKTSLFPQLFAWNEEALQNLLNEHAEVLQAAGWSTKPEEFARRVVRETVVPPNKLFDVIADAFGDKTNTGRTEFAGKGPRTRAIEPVASAGLEGEEKEFADFIRRRNHLVRSLPSALDAEVRAGTLTHGERIGKIKEFLDAIVAKQKKFNSIDEYKRARIETGVIHEMKAERGDA